MKPHQPFNKVPTKPANRLPNGAEQKRISASKVRWKSVAWERKQAGKPVDFVLMVPICP